MIDQDTIRVWNRDKCHLFTRTGIWRCLECTFINPLELLSCQMCQSPDLSRPGDHHRMYSKCPRPNCRQYVHLYTRPHRAMYLPRLQHPPGSCALRRSQEDVRQGERIKVIESPSAPDPGRKAARRMKALYTMPRGVCTECGTRLVRAIMGWICPNIHLHR